VTDEKLTPIKQQYMCSEYSALVCIQTHLLQDALQLISRVVTNDHLAFTLAAVGQFHLGA